MGRGVDLAQLAQVGPRAPLDRVARPLGLTLETLGLQLRAGEQFTPAELRSIVSLVQTTLEVFAAPPSGDPASHADFVARGDAVGGGDAVLREAVLVVRALQGDLAHVFTQQRQMTSALAPLLQELLVTTGDALVSSAGPVSLPPLATDQSLAGAGEFQGASGTGRFAGAGQTDGYGGARLADGYAAAGQTDGFTGAKPADGNGAASGAAGLASARAASGSSGAGVYAAAGEASGGIGASAGGRNGRVGASSPALLARLMAGMAEAIESLGTQGTAGAQQGPASLASAAAGLAEAIAALQESLLPWAARGADRSGAPRLAVLGDAGAAAAGATGGVAGDARATAGVTGLVREAGVAAGLTGGAARDAGVAVGATHGSLTAGTAQRLVTAPVASRLVQALAMVIARLQALVPPRAMPRALALALAEAMLLVDESVLLAEAAAQQTESPGTAERFVPPPRDPTLAQGRSGGAASGAAGQPGLDPSRDAATLAPPIARILAALEQLSPTPAGTPAQLAAAGQNPRTPDGRSPPLAPAALPAALPPALDDALSVIKSQLQALLSLALRESTATDDAAPLEKAALLADLELLARAAPPSLTYDPALTRSEPFDPYRWGLVAALNYRAERRRPRDRTPDPEHCENCGRLLVRTLTDALVCPADC
jgi:hypothetical protein